MAPPKAAGTSMGIFSLYCSLFSSSYAPNYRDTGMVFESIDHQVLTNDNITNMILSNDLEAREMYEKYKKRRP